MSPIFLPFLCLEMLGESILSIQSSEKVTSISLPPTPPYHTLEFHLEVLCVIPSGAEQHANEWLTNGEVRHRPRSYSLPDTPMTAIDLRVRKLICSLECNPLELYHHWVEGWRKYLYCKSTHFWFSKANVASLHVSSSWKLFIYKMHL